MLGMALVLTTTLVTATDVFEPLKAKAVEVESLQRLLQAYGGGCTSEDLVEKKECEERAKKEQAFFKGKLLHVNLGGGFERLMEPLETDPGQAGIILTPVFDVGAGLALTFAKPQKLDKDGNIMVGRMPVDGPLLDDTLMASDIKRLIRTGQVMLEVVCQVKGPWSLARKGGEPVKGLEVQVKAIRLSNRRGGKPIVSMTR
jgi:hypothetical protein